MRKLVEVEPLFQEALQASRKVLGDEHADTLTPISNNIVGTLHIEIIVGGHAPPLTACGAPPTPGLARPIFIYPPMHSR